MSDRMAVTVEEAASSKASAVEVEGWVHRVGRLVDRSSGLLKWLADRESAALRARLDEVSIRAPIYVTGLARSGSTILLELLAEHPALATHRYRDFPVVLAPWSWNWFLDRAASRDADPRERAHGDGIAVTPESPEGFEEVIWMAFFERLHDSNKNAVLDGGTEAPGFERFYRDHIRKLLLLRGGERYLAKNNYDVTRLGYLLKLFPDARFLIPIRDPVWHIASLMKQHRLFVEAEERDPRVLEHMARSGHFEFGLNRRVINTGDDAAAAIVEDLWKSEKEVEGWARYWALIYGHVADTLQRVPEIDAAAKIVRYEDLCAEPLDTMRAMLDHCGLARSDLPERTARRVSPPGYYRPSFTPSEEALIRDVTGAVARRFGYDF